MVALAGERGRYDKISERTIRDDIRVMRSDILGFNAPIKQKNGLYFYADLHYSILSLSLTDGELVSKIIKLLLAIREDVKHPELEIILNKLVKLFGDDLHVKPSALLVKEAEPDEFFKYNYYMQSEKMRKYIDSTVEADKFSEVHKMLTNIPGMKQDEKLNISIDLQASFLVTWGEILGLLK
jgi:hypothetical protein